MTKPVGFGVKFELWAKIIHAAAKQTSVDEANRNRNCIEKYA